MIEICNLTKKYNQQIIFENTSAKFPSIGLIGIVGKSGEGKSTLLNLVSLLDFDYEGDILFDNQNYKEISDKEKYRFSNFGFVFQNYSLFELMSIKDNVLVNSQNKDDIASAMYALKQVGLTQSLNKKVNLLSGGEKQRVAIARALINHPKVLFCDEPTGALDENNKHKIMTLLKEISKSCLVIIVSHEIELLNKYTSCIYEIKNKKINHLDSGNYEIAQHKKVEKNNTLSFMYMFNYVFSHLKAKKVRTFICLTSIALGLLCIGISLVLTSMVGDNIKQSVLSLMDGSKIEVCLKDDSNFNETYALSQSGVEDIALKYKSYVRGVGSYYLADFENKFINANYLTFTSGNYEIDFNEVSARNINEVTYINDVEKNLILPYCPSKLEDDEVILKLREKDVKRVCDSLRIENNISSLSNYLLNHELSFMMNFANEEWEYNDQVYLHSKAFMIAQDIGFIHTSLTWNELIFERVMHFKSSDDLIAYDPIPWTLKKVFYLKCNSKNRNKLLEILLHDESLDELYFDYFNTNEFYTLRKDLIPLDMIYVTIQNKNKISFSNIEKISKENNFFNYIPSTRQSYLIIDSLMLHAFSNLTMLSRNEKLLDEFIDEYSLSEENINIKNFRELENDLIIGGLGSMSSNNNLKFDCQNNINNLYGRMADNESEVVVSYPIVKCLFPNENNSQIINKTIDFLSVKDISFDGNTYKNNFVKTKIKIVGIDMDNIASNIIYASSEWPIYFYANVLNFKVSDLCVESVIFSTEYNKINQQIVDKLNENSRYYVFKNPSLSYSDSIDKVIQYIDLGMLVFSFIAIVSSTLMTILVIYLYIVENKKEIGLLMAIGIERKSIRKLFILFSIILGGISFLYSSISLLFTTFAMSYMLNNTFFSFEVINLVLADVLMLCIILTISFFIGYFSSSQALKYDPLIVLKEK